MNKNIFIYRKIKQNENQRYLKRLQLRLNLKEKVTIMKTNEIDLFLFCLKLHFEKLKFKDRSTEKKKTFENRK